MRTNAQQLKWFYCVFVATVVYPNIFFCCPLSLVLYFRQQCRDSVFATILSSMQMTFTHYLSIRCQLYSIISASFTCQSRRKCVNLFDFLCYLVWMCLITLLSKSIIPNWNTWIQNQSVRNRIAKNLFIRIRFFFFRFWYQIISWKSVAYQNEWQNVCIPSLIINDPTTTHLSWRFY